MSPAPEIIVACADCRAESGSVAAVSIRQAAELAKRFSVTIISDRLPQPAPPGVATVSVPKRGFVLLRRFAHVPAQYAFARRVGRSLAQRHRERPIAAVICHSHALATVGALPFRRRSGVPYALAMHGDIFDRPPGTYDPRLTWFYRRVTPPAYRNAGRVLALSPYFAECALRGGAPEERIRVVPNGIDPAEIGVDLTGSAVGFEGPRDAKLLRLIYVGNLGIEKGADILIAACGRLAVAGVSFELELVGDGPQRSELERVVRTTGLGAQVRFVGRQPRAKLGARFGTAHVACVPSRSEAQATVILEALIAGCPVVASTAGGNPSMVRHGENGLLVPVGDPRALADALAGLAADRALLERLARSARPSIWPEFSWERRGTRLADVMAELVAEGDR